MKTDITDRVQRYRLALRYIWNSCFWGDPNLRTWDSVYSYRSLKVPLFKAVIGEPLELEPNDQIFGAGFEIVPDMIDGVGISMMQVNRWVPSSPDAGVWEPLNGPFKADDVRLTLIDLFDWTPMGYIDLRYYVVLIEAFRSHPDKIGQHALVDVTQAQVLYSSRQ